ncbi:MAG: site-specific DNA-methyltransferase [Calditrichaeota bacterium]|nr:site-specific DNA-methyltransferase [Calditrichota bacterium]
MTDIEASLLILGDNLQTLRAYIPDASVDLVYMDPPFNSGRNYTILDSKSSVELLHDTFIRTEEFGSFQDTWRWDADSADNIRSLLKSSPPGVVRALNAFKELLGECGFLAYITMLAPRIIELWRVLKETGSIYVHCDQRASAHIRILMDAVFGAANYLNTIVWCYGLGGSSRRYWPQKHDDILWYSRTPNRHYFEPARIPATSQRMKGQTKKAPDYWLIPTVNNMARERVGYPTQKPLALLERIVISSSPEGGVVLDPFCGSGTTLVAAECNRRRWVGIDKNSTALNIAQNRLNNILYRPVYSYIDAVIINKTE